MTKSIAPAKVLVGIPLGRETPHHATKALLRFAMGQRVDSPLPDMATVKTFIRMVAQAHATDFESITADVVEAFLQFAVGPRAGQVELIDVPYQATAAARNYMARYLTQRPDATHLLMLDDDHIHPPDIVARLLRWWQQDNNRKIVAGLVYRRVMPHDPLLCIEAADGTLSTMIPPYPATLFPIDGVVATSAMLIHRSVFEHVPPPWFYVETEADGITQNTEDYPFCRKVRKYGFNIWVDPDCRSPHLGTELVDEETWLRCNPDIAQRAKKLSVPMVN